MNLIREKGSAGEAWATRVALRWADLSTTGRMYTLKEISFSLNLIREEGGAAKALSVIVIIGVDRSKYMPAERLPAVSDLLSNLFCVFEA